jgi:[ribosomal protein S18]-alanine N-acetyltransferase
MSAMLSPHREVPLTFAILRDADLDRVAEIEADVYAFPWSRGNFRDSLLSGYVCWGCWAEGKLIGYAIIMTALDEAHLLNFAIAHDWQRRGMGGRFLSFVIADARKMQCEMIFLEVRPSNLVGRRLYDRFGFKQLGLRRDYYPAALGREDALFLGLNLNRGVEQLSL